jgi:ABC-type dipeptide/oligopeptide/nickel transport system permease subunit
MAALDLARHPGGQGGLVLLTLLISLALVGPLIAPGGPNQLNPSDALQAPSTAHWFGTDELGRDVLARVAAAAPIAFYLTGASVLLAIVFGAPLGLVAGYAGGLVELSLMWLMDVLFSLPALLLALVVVGISGPSVNNAILAVAVVYIPRFARIARGSTRSISTRVYVEAARCLGAGGGRIVWRHVLPNILGPMIVQTSLALSTAELAHASLSFLGLGVQPPTADWGVMLAKARSLMTVAPWLAVFPSLAVILLIVAFNLLGDALRDLLDPRRPTEAAQAAGL